MTRRCECISLFMYNFIVACYHKNMNSRLYEIRCPKCDSVWMIKCESVVHAENEKTLKKLIIDEAFFTRKCSKCNELITFYYPFLYCDIKRKFLIALIVDDEVSWLNELDKVDVYKDFKKRIVHNGKELKEKILIYEYGFDDEGIEVIKKQLDKKYQYLRFESADHEFIWFESEKGPIGVEQKFYKKTPSRKENFIY